MPIEFNCPNCNAIIRVPDSAGGGKGRCPRCATRIKVPKKSTPRVEKKADDIQLEVFAPPADDELEVQFAGDDESAPTEPQSLEDILAPKSHTLGQFPVETPRRGLGPTAVASKLKRKQSSVPWQVPVFFGLILCGGFGWYYWQLQQGEKLAGELTAETAATLDLKPVELNASMFNRSAEEMKTYWEELQNSPVPLRSVLMYVTIGASKRAVTVAIAAGTQTHFYRVDAQKDPVLSKFRSDHGVEFEELRAAEIDVSGQAFLNEYQRVLNKESKAAALNEYRDTLALPALVHGFGHQVIAAAGQKMYRCVYEDNAGALYFLLPPETQEFEIIGRQHKNGKTLFAGKYRVKVIGEIKPPSDKKSKKSTEDADKPSMSETAEDGDMKESKKGMDDDEMKMDDKPKKKMMDTPKDK